MNCSHSSELTKTCNVLIELNAATWFLLHPLSFAAFVAALFVSILSHHVFVLNMLQFFVAILVIEGSSPPPFFLMGSAIIQPAHQQMG